MKPIAMLLALLGMPLLGGHAMAAESSNCAPTGNLHYICGIYNAEDLVQIPDTPYIIGSGFAGGGASVGRLHLINTKTKTWTTLFPGKTPSEQWDKAVYKDCPGAPDLTKFSTHGLNLKERNGVETLWVVNHGGADRIDVFTVDAKATPAPTVTWIGCAVMPAHTWPNAVAGLPDGGFVVTDMFDPDDKDAPDKMNAGKVTGAVYEWHPNSGFKQVPNSEMSGANGIEVSPDGKDVFVNAWGNKEVVRLALDGSSAERKTIPAGFLVDNLRWAPDGMLMVAGQDVAASKVFACFQSKAVRCTEGWRVLKWDTKAMTITPVVTEKGNEYFGGGTTALIAGNETYVGTFRGDRIAYFETGK